MDDLTASYYHPPPPPPPPPHYPYYQPPPPPPAAPPPLAQHPAPPFPPPYHHSQPSFPSHYSLTPPPFASCDDEVRTLFVAGLPDDVKPREIHNLFREFPGFESSQLRSSGPSSQAYAFAVFADQQSALAAKHALNGMLFDLEKESTLFVDLAKSNSRSKRLRTDDGVTYVMDKNVWSSFAYSRDFSDSGVRSNTHMSGIGNTAHSMNAYASARSHATFAHETINQSDFRKMSSNDPCPTLFVANLGPTCSEQELKDVFSRCPGFLKLKMQNRNGVPVAFVDFQDVTCSTGALNNLQGIHLFSSVREGMRLEYARARMGLRKRERKRERKT